MPPHDQTIPGWTAPRQPPRVPTPSPGDPPRVPTPLGTVDAAAIDPRVGPLTAWRRTRKRVPTPRPRGRLTPVLPSEPRMALDIADFHELRREGLFTDDGRNPPPSWWTR